MYSRVYGEGRNYSRQNTYILRERTLRRREEFYRSAGRFSFDDLCLYGSRRNRSRPHERDSLFWERHLNTTGLERLKLAREAEKEEEEKLVIPVEKLEEKEAEVLKVQMQDLHINENASDHKTQHYDCVTDEKSPQIVVRRGQEFKITLFFKRHWDGKMDDMYLIFKIGENPSQNKGTFVKVKLEEGNDTSYKDGVRKQWGARIISQDSNNLTIAVYSPPHTIIGEWEYAIQTEKMDGLKKKIFQSRGADDIIILLNPYCKDDQVYMPEQQELEEYIENEDGISYYGTSSDIDDKEWFYGQFQEDILEICLHILRKAFDFEITKKMADPVEIARGLSRIINGNDDNGVLIGKWGGDYSAGTRPTEWRGSAAILRKYYNTRESVLYGQCWVFSHVLTAVARALGLPCRSVTNFQSAHDTEKSMTIDRYVDAAGNRLNSPDSIWNFHVWNEVWMNRPDLDKLLNAEGKYNGWHACDATPQEASEYMMQCGPAPLSAIRHGEMHVGYDTKFIFAEVNADVCTWMKHPGGDILVDQVSNHVGKFISTKKPTGEPKRPFWKLPFGESDRLDVTHLYKHPEGSVAEREAVQKALSDGDIGKHLFHNPTGVKISVLPVGSVKLGEDVMATIKVENTSDQKCSVRVTANVKPMTYWGDTIGSRLIASNTFSEAVIEPNQSQNLEVRIEAERYLSECDEHHAMSVLAMGTVRGFDDHEKHVHTSLDVVIQGPKMIIKGPEDDVKAGEPVTVDIEFTNPLKMNLKNCFLIVGGSVSLDESGFEKNDSGYKKKIEDVKAEETRKIKLTVRPSARPSNTKKRNLEVGIASDTLPLIEGDFHFSLRA